MKVYLVEGEHWYQYGRPSKIFATRKLANQEAAEFVNILRSDVDATEDTHLAADATADNWEAKLEEARELRAKNFNCDPEDLAEDDGGVWITEHDVIEE